MERLWGKLDNIVVILYMGYLHSHRTCVRWISLGLAGSDPSGSTLGLDVPISYVEGMSF